MLESIRQKLASYIPSERQTKIFASGLAFGIASAVALNAIGKVAKSIISAADSNRGNNASHEIPTDSQKV